jgi:hypothetical protein
MTFQDLSWIFVALSLIGNLFVIKKNVIGQWLWMIANMGWILFNLWLGIYSQAFLFGAYLLMSIWGIISWSREASQDVNQETAVGVGQKAQSFEP